jgi:DNA repair protein SbcD/Mre11
MNKIKFLHTADLHLDSPFKGLKNLPDSIFTRIKNSTFSAFDRILQIAIEQKVDFVVIAGDVYDRELRSVQAQTRLRKGFEMLANHEVTVFISHGNHDHIGGDWLSINWPKNVHFFKNGIVEMLPYYKNNHTTVHLYGFSYPQRAVTDNKTMEYKKVEGAKYHIGILHGALEGNSEHNRYAPFTVNQLVEKRFNYWALGHIHQKQILHESPHIIYPGNIQGLHRGEKGEKGCYLVELHDSETTIQFFQTNTVKWDTAEIDISSFQRFDELLFACEREKEALRQKQESTMLHLKIVGSGSLHQDLQEASIMEELLDYLQEGEEAEECFIWVESVDVETASYYNRDELLKENGFIGELLVGPYLQDELTEILNPLLGNRKFKKVFTHYSQDELEEILEKAEKLLMYQLMKE